MKKWDMKSVVIGALAALALVVTAGAAYKPAEAVGRYQVVISGDRTYYALVIDTVTGQVWDRTDDDFKKKKE